MERDLTIIVEERLSSLHVSEIIVLFSVNRCLLSVFLARVRKKRAARSIGDDRKFAFKIEQNHAENHSKFPHYYYSRVPVKMRQLMSLQDGCRALSLRELNLARYPI